MSLVAAAREARARHRRPTWPLERRIRSWLAAVPAPDPAAFARFGDGSWIVPPVHVSEREAALVEVGAGVVVLEHAHLCVGDGGHITLGDGVRLGPFASLHATTSIVLEAGVSSSDHVAVVDGWPDPRAGSDPVGVPDRAPAGGAVLVREGAYLGAGCTIGPGVTVGRGAFVGEGSVVLHDVPDHAVVYGNPARVVRQLDGDGRWDGPAPVGRSGSAR